MTAETTLADKPPRKKTRSTTKSAYDLTHPEPLPINLPPSLRSIVLNHLLLLNCFTTAKEIAVATRMSYPQAMFALNALHNDQRVERKGSKSTATWGTVGLSPINNNNFALLHALFHQRTGKRKRRG